MTMIIPQKSNPNAPQIPMAILLRGVTDDWAGLLRAAHRHDLDDEKTS